MRKVGLGGTPEPTVISMNGGGEAQGDVREVGLGGTPDPTFFSITGGGGVREMCARWALVVHLTQRSSATTGGGGELKVMCTRWALVVRLTQLLSA